MSPPTWPSELLVTSYWPGAGFWSSWRNSWKYFSVSFLLKRGPVIFVPGAFALTAESFTSYAPGPGLLETFSNADLALWLPSEARICTLGLVILSWSLYCPGPGSVASSFLLDLLRFDLLAV